MLNTKQYLRKNETNDIICEVCAVCARDDDPAEGAPGGAPSQHPPRQDQRRLRQGQQQTKSGLATEFIKNHNEVKAKGDSVQCCGSV